MKFLRSKYFYAVIPILIIVSGALYLFWPMLSGRSLFPPSNIGLYHYMYFTEMKHFVYDLGMLPNWWPAYNSGYPINLTLDAFLNPVFITALNYLPPFLTNNLMVFIFFVVNGLSLYALGRALHLSRVGSLIAAISYAFSGVVMQYTPTTGIVALMFFLPLSFLCCLKIFQGKKLWILVWLAVLIYSWIGGWSEMIIYALTAVGCFAFYISIKERRSGNFKYRYPAIFFSAIIVSIIVLLPWFLSVLYFVSYSSRAGGVGGAAASFMPTTLPGLINLVHPRLSVFYGNLLPFFSFNNYGYFLYIGTLPALLIFMNLFVKNIKEKKHLPFFIGLAAVSILTTINHSPLFWILHKLPVLQWFNGYWKWDFVVVFSLAILAGYGVDNIRFFFQHRRSRQIILTLWAFVILITLGVGVVTVFDNQIKSFFVSYGVSRYHNNPDRVFNRSDNYYRAVIEEIADSVVSNLSFKNGLVLLTFGLWLLALIHLTLGRYELIPHQKWRELSVAVTLLGSVLVWTGWWDGVPASYLKTEPDTAKYLHSVNPYTSHKLPINTRDSQTLTPYRIFLYTPDQYVAVISEKYKTNLRENAVRYPFAREMMDNNIHIMFNFDAFANHQTLSLKRLEDVYNLARKQKQFSQESYGDTTSFEKYIEAFSNEKNMRLLGALNIQYVLTPFELKTSSQPIFTTKVGAKDIPIYIYQNPYFMPRWYFANRIFWSGENDTEALKNLQTVSDFKETTLIETRTLNDQAIATQPNSNDKIELELYTAGVLRVKTRTKGYRFFVFSESRFPPFWQATINNNKTPIYTANYLYQAVLVPPGENTIEFRYPKIWEQGLISTQQYLQFSP